MDDQLRPWRAFGTWIAVEVDGCTCAGFPPYGHEPHCGYEPAFQVTTEADAVAAARNADVAAAEARGRQQAIDELRAEAERLDEICPPETDLGFRGHREAANWLELAATAPDLWATVHVEHPDGTAEPAFGQMDEVDDEGLIARGRQQMIDALRDFERFAAWWDVQPWAEHDEDAWMTEGQLTSAADYLDSIAKEGSHVQEA